MSKEKKAVNEEVNASEETVEQTTETPNEKTEETPVAENEEDENAKLAEQVADWQDKYMRLSAEFDNFRKRTLREKMGLIESASEDVVKSILPIMDDLQRAEEANKESDDIEAIKTGMNLISKKFLDTLTQKGLIEIEAMDKEFNTDVHEAIARFPVDEKKKKGCIIDVVEKGYKLKEKVIRFSKVVVGE